MTLNDIIFLNMYSKELRAILLLIVAATLGNIPVTAIAQGFDIKRVEVDGDLVNLYYDLTDTTSRRAYTVSVYSSRDNYISPLDHVSGDLGLEVKPGANKKISWNTRQALGETFQGEVALEIRGRVYIPFVRIDGQYSSFKRMKPYEITWTGGTQQNILNFDLYKDGEKVTTFPNIANVGHYTLTLPASVKPGKGYSFKITDTKNKDQIVNTSTFTVKRKIPLLVKAVPVGLVGAFLFWIINSEEPSPQQSIPVAPDPNDIEG
jgi:hypothetical protein